MSIFCRKNRTNRVAPTDRDERPSRTARPSFILLCWSLFVLFVFLAGGCSTALFSTDNKFLLCLPGAERRSDQIPGVLRPWERASLIEEKGRKGKNASLEEKEILAQQLIQEYRKSADPNIRRASVEALGKIVVNAHIVPVLNILDKAFYEDSLGVRISACDALGNYCSEGKGQEENPDIRKAIAGKLCLRYGQLPYSVDAGAKKENDERKDLRLAIVRNLAKFNVDDSPEILATLGDALEGETLDDGSLQVAAIRSLELVTKRNYGINSEKWSEYLAFVRGETAREPEEISLLQKMPKPDLPMLK